MMATVNSRWIHESSRVERLMKLNSDRSLNFSTAILLESVLMDLRVIETKRAFCGWIVEIGNLGLHLLWRFVHLSVSIWYVALSVIDALESYFISCGLLKKYKSLDISKVRCLAIVVESEESYQTSSVIKLLQWVAALGVNHVCLYDMDGVLKKSKDFFLQKCEANLWKGTDVSKPLLDPSQLTLEFISLSDGREGVAKAANYLLMKHVESNGQGEVLERPNFTELEMNEALRAVGAAGLDPDLLFVYGPARCHLGFPAWRIRYTEIVHMGPLKSMKYGSLIKAIHKFTTVRQNYGK